MAAVPPWRTGTTTMTPAYTAVDARRTLQPRASAPTAAARIPWTMRDDSTSANPQTSQSPPASGNRTTFPDKLKQYVARTFEDCSLEDKPEVEAELKRIITDAFNEKIVWSVDWDNMALPQAIMANRKAAEREEKRKNSIGVESANHGVGKMSLGDKKRKSSGGDDFVPSNKLFDRIDTKKARHTIEADRISEKEKAKRAARFAGQLGPSPPVSRSNTWNEETNNLGPVVGRCTTLEKRFFRLTSAPNPDHVRPLHILEQTLELLKNKWRTEQNYSYICDQFKSLRQDLTVQHIKNAFTVTVYEIHARIALEKGDLGEYNQCQSQLATLYKEGLPGHKEEFLAYRILYLLHTCNRADMNDLLANLTQTDKSDPSVQHALEVRNALATSNYHKFFKLYLEAPSMGGYLMDSFVPRERLAALATICKAYRPDIDIRFLTEELGFENDPECVAFLCNNGAEHLLEEKPNPSGGAPSIRFKTVQGLPIFEQAKQQAFRKVDIKGQM